MKNTTLVHCRDCKCWGKPGDKERAIDICMRFPPQINIWHDSENGPQWDQSYPLVGPNDGCFEGIERPQV